MAILLSIVEGVVDFPTAIFYNFLSFFSKRNFGEKIFLTRKFINKKFERQKLRNFVKRNLASRIEKILHPKKILRIKKFASKSKRKKVWVKFWSVKKIC